jgi:hypothetical protein
LTDDNELDARLARLDPARALAVDDQALDHLMDGARLSSRRRPRSWKFVSAVITGGVIVLGAGALPAAAVIQAILAQVVESPPGAGTEAIPESDWIDTGAEDIDAFVASRYPEDLPLPGGVDPADVVTTVSFSISQSSGLRQEIGVDVAYESYIYCRWVDVWLTTDAGGDAAGREYAATIMMDATTWPARVATDGGGVVDSQIAFAQAATAGDREEVQTAFAFNGCPGWKALGSEQ